MLLQFWLSLPTMHTNSKLIQISDFCLPRLPLSSDQPSGPSTGLTPEDPCRLHLAHDIWCLQPPRKGLIVLWSQYGNLGTAIPTQPQAVKQIHTFSSCLQTFYFAFSTQREGGEKGEGAYSLVRSRDPELSWSAAWKEQNDLQWVFSSFLLWQIIL